MSRFGDYVERVCCHLSKWDGIHDIVSTKSSALSKTVFLVRLAFGQASTNHQKKAAASANEDDDLPRKTVV
jgi:hypothetical protein